MDRLVERRPDGDLTIRGTSVWMPADRARLIVEYHWCLDRLADLEAAAAYLDRQELKELHDKFNSAQHEKGSV